MPAMYLLRTFGGLTLTHATTHQLIGAARRKPLALLAIVAASGDRWVERDGIATMLWPKLGVATAPWCWTGAHDVRVVPGVLRARISAGENVMMTMVTNRLPGGRTRYCSYSPALRMSLN